MLIDVPKVRNVSMTGLLGDIESHLPANHPYRDNDRVTWAHEGTHGVNANIRNKHSGKNNAMYILNDRAYLFDEPNCTLNDVAQRVPTELKGSGYQLYLIDQQRYWNKEPLYIYDELCAYMNGTKIGIDEDVEFERVEYTFKKTVEFLGYALTLIHLVQDVSLEAFPQYVNEYAITLLRTFPRVYEDYKKLKGYIPLWY